MNIAVNYNTKYVSEGAVSLLRKQLLAADHHVVLFSDESHSIQELKDIDTRLDILIALDPDNMPELDLPSGLMIWTFDLLLEKNRFNPPAIQKVSCSRNKNLKIELLAFDNPDEIKVLQTIDMPVNLKFGIGIPSHRQLLEACLPYLTRNLNILSIRGKDLYHQAVSRRVDTTPVRLNFLDRIHFKFKKLNQRFDELLHFYHWNVGIAEADIFSARNEGFNTINWLKGYHKEHTYADPFFLEKDGIIYVFFEDIHLKAYKGHISVSEFENGSWSDPVPVITKDYTLSFPSLFEYDGDVYCLPEAREAEKTIFYKAAEFPARWEECKVIFDDFPIVDPQVFHHDNTYWMFFSPATYGRWNQLYIYYADNPLDKWHPHPLNPVKTDLRFSRNAGSIFSHQGKVFRPSMDNSEIYGKRVILNEITRLSVSDFNEQELFSIGPEDYPFKSDKTHTISSSGKLVVLDSCIKKRTWTSKSFLQRKISQIIS